MSEEQNPKLKPIIIGPRLLAVFKACGYEEYGGRTAFLEASGIASSAWFEATVSLKRCSAELVQAVIEATNARAEYLVEGQEPMFEEAGAKTWARKERSATKAASKPAKERKARKPKGDDGQDARATVAPALVEQAGEEEAMVREYLEAWSRFKAARARVAEALTREVTL